MRLLTRAREAAERFVFRFTPGPYRLVQAHAHGCQTIVTDARPQRVFGSRNEFHSPFIVVQPGMYTSATGDELEANICLFLNAPEMVHQLMENLEAMKRMDDMLLRLTKSPRDCEKGEITRTRTLLETVANGKVWD
jgi:hypothetical protein